MKCIVKNCSNHDYEGTGLWLDIHFTEITRPFWICIPCFNFLTKGIGKESQIYRNAHINEQEGSTNEKENS